MSVIWHDLECGGYRADLPLWRSLAKQQGEPILDVGAGAGRVTIDLASRGYAVTALDRDRLLLQELARRATELPVDTIVADARDFDLDGRRFALCLVPMQTIQLLGGPDGRKLFLQRARQHLAQDGLVAIAITEELELYEVHEGDPAPLPDMRELEGVLYASQPTAIRAEGTTFVLERRRETITSAGSRTVAHDVIRLSRLSCDELETEAVAAGLHPAGRTTIRPTNDHVGSEVVMLRA